MPRIVPTQAIELIDNFFARAQTHETFLVPFADTARLAAVLSFIEQIPSELLTLTGQDLSNYAAALAMAKRVQHVWSTRAENVTLEDIQGVSPIVLLRKALAKCPDEAPAPGTTELAFITDPDLRDSIRRDISSANQNMVHGEWKGATVLAGSAAEALLLWAIQEAERQKTGAIKAATASLVSSGTLANAPNSNPERWNFVELIEVGLGLGLITTETATQARLGKDFRNLIHPGRTARLGQVCDRATALSALAAAEHVVRDLTP
jgi:hypothetical protein